MSQKELPAVPEAILSKFMWRGQGRGWITSEIMLESVQKVFIPEIVKRRKEAGLPDDAPALLLMDGHASHRTLELHAALAAAHIDLRHFVPHASHVMQPLDLVLFGAYKAQLKSVCCFSLFSVFHFLLTASLSESSSCWERTFLWQQRPTDATST